MQQADDQNDRFPSWGCYRANLGGLRSSQVPGNMQTYLLHWPRIGPAVCHFNNRMKKRLTRNYNESLGGGEKEIMMGGQDRTEQSKPEIQSAKSPWPKAKKNVSCCREIIAHWQSACFPCFNPYLAWLEKFIYLSTLFTTIPWDGSLKLVIIYSMKRNHETSKINRIQNNWPETLTNK